MTVFRWVGVASLLVAGGAGLLRLGRIRDERAVEPLWEELAADNTNEVVLFQPAMVDSLPAPARRFLLRAIAPGTPLATSARLRMHGSMRLQPDGTLLAMQADQILAPPRGLVWKARVSKGALRIRGFDSYGRGSGRLCWWLFGLIPVVRAHGADIDRSAAGRLAGEAVLVPAALLPQFGTRWEAVDDSAAAFEIDVGDESVRVVTTVDDAGRLQRVRIRRWRDDTGDGTSGCDAFDVDEFSNERAFGGYTIPTTFRAGWRLGDPDAFPFFYATIEEAEYR